MHQKEDQIREGLVNLHSKSMSTVAKLYELPEPIAFSASLNFSAKAAFKDESVMEGKFTAGVPKER